MITTLFEIIVIVTIVAPILRVAAPNVINVMVIINGTSVIVSKADVIVLVVVVVIVVVVVTAVVQVGEVAGRILAAISVVVIVAPAGREGLSLNVVSFVRAVALVVAPPTLTVFIVLFA